MLRTYLRQRYRSPFLILSSRNKGSLGLWESNISSEIKLKIEQHWSKEVSRNEQCKNTNGDNHFYVLPMFPYPSGNLHMGHVRVYSISDTLARFYKLNGKNVIHPMGWDAFGLPAENAAIERNIQPNVWTKTNIDSMKKQLIQLGFNFDWEREISTCDPSYFKWTQYIFLKLFEKGLVYQNKANVNWDPVDKTVLADEQVDDNGCSWRSGAKVEKKVLTQWFIKTTKFAKDLYDGLDSDFLENWKDIINLQKHWIGECNGIVITFQVKIKNANRSIDVWSSHPYKFKHAEYLTIKSDSVLIEELTSNEINNLVCYNPITDSEIKILVCDSVNYPDGQDTYLVCPSLDIEDRKICESLSKPFEDGNNTINWESENKKVIDIAKSKNCGGYFVSSKLKDWLISRQRYWGTPIPVIHCDKCGVVPVPYNELPVELPPALSKDEATIKLSKIQDWVACKCPKCKKNAWRETDTMDTFVDSSWYYYRFLDFNNDNAPFELNKLKGKTPVNCYIGGKEHAVLHLYYARFMSYFLHSLGWTPMKEPFKKLLVQGMVMGQSYKLKSSGKYIAPEQVEKVGKAFRQKTTGEAVIAQWEKMSKSKHNGVNPLTLLSEYGCDTTRLLILADVPPATTRRWSNATLPGVLNWQHRLWITMREFLNHRQNSKLEHNLSSEIFNDYENKIYTARNYFTAATTYHFKYTQKLSVGISQLQSLTNVLRNNVPVEVITRSKEFELALGTLIIMLSPITPHFCSELWAGLLSAPNRISEHLHLIAWDKNILYQTWPKVDKDFELSFQCKVDGVHLCDLKVVASELPSLTEDKAFDMVMKEDIIVKRTKRGIQRMNYELYPDCRAILNIFTNQTTLKSKDQLKLSS